jgi:putative transposase
MLKALKIRLYPNKEQESYIKTLLGSYRFVYNQCLDKKIKSYTNDKKNLGLKELGNFFHQELTKNNEFQWLNEHNTKVLKQSVIDLLDSYKRFFVNGNGFPKFKSKHDNKQSCRFPLESISKRNVYSEYKLTLSNIKNIKFKCSENYVKYLDKNKETIKSATLSKTKSGKYFLSILVDGDLLKKNNIPKNEFIGLDLGIKTFIVDSNGNTFENIKIKRNNQKKLNKLHKELSRKEKGSNNRNKSKLKLAKLYEKLNNKKENYLHSITNQLINENQVIIIENLNVRGMMKNHNLAKSIQELSLYRFKEMLRYKSEWYDNDIVEIDRYHPSSKLCSVCGHKNNDLKLSDRDWKCSNCGSTHDRDKNAAINILNEGMKLYKNKIPTRCGELKPLESSDNTLDELGNRDLHNFV